MIRRLPQSGLILDVRGNGGGLVPAGERLLQLLTRRRITPSRFHFIPTRLTQRLCEFPEFVEWRESILQATATGAEYSLGFPLVSEDECNDIGQKYQGPVVLVTDAQCYSTTDIFAAGFQDHAIGKILGVHGNTGAGGANVWTYELIQELLRGTGQSLPKLPRGTSFTVAVRRTTRVGKHAGVPQEDLGVKPDEVRRMTLKDVMERNADLIEHAAELLSKMPKQSLTAKLTRTTRDAIDYELETTGINRVDLSLNDRPVQTVDVKDGTKSFRLAIKHGFPKGKFRLKLFGYRGHELAVSETV